jgi:hypothetical protein
MTTLTQRRAGGVLLAALATLVGSTVYYIVFGAVYQHLRGGASASPEAWTILAQFGRNALVAFVLATLLRWLSITDRRAAVRLGVLVWLGFQAMEVLGSVLHEHYPFGLYLLHVGDALLTTLIMALILGRKAL